MQVLYRMSASLLLVVVAAVAPTDAHAGLTVEANVVVTDDAGGTLTLISSATHELAGSNVMTTADFDDFRPNPDGRSIDGEIVRVRSRDVESIESTYDGSLEISGSAGDEAFNTLLLEGVTVHREGQGPELSGTVIYNGQAIDAAELPTKLAAALRRILRFFHFA